MLVLSQSSTANFARLLIVAWLLLATGCCGNLLVSQRFNEGDIVGGCATGDCTTGEEDPGPGRRPGMELQQPTICWPAWMHRHHWLMARHRMKDSINEFLEPGPPPPTKPPHSRFHPLPTQPVFAQRAAYQPPEVIGLTPEQMQILKETSQHPLLPENIPTPVAEPMPSNQPSPALAPPAASPPDNNPLRNAPANRAPQLLPPPTDPIRGPIAPATHLSAEPNPLR